MIYAIGVVRETNGEIGVRLLNPDKMQCVDVNQRDISFYCNRDDGIKNLEVNKKGEIKWKQGAADRYPIIDKITQQVRNDTSVVVLGVADINGEKFYKICNYTGQIVNISARELIQYGKTYKIANCKVVNKNGVEFISAIEGNIEEISTKPKLRIDLETQCLIIEIPYLMSDELVIPDILNGRPMCDIESIKIEPASSALQIKKLKLSKYIKMITSSLFFSLRNLEEITLYGDGIDIYDDTFILLKNLRKINVNRVRACGQGFCQGLKNLEEFNSKVALPYIPSHAFAGCENLKIETVLKEGVREIYTKGFAGNRVVTHLTLPSTLKETAYNAFEKCKNLREVNCKTEILKVSNGRANDGKLFTGLGEIRLNINKHCVITEKDVAENVKLIRRADSERDKTIEKQIKKGNMLGLSLNADTIVTNPRDIAQVISIVDQNIITNAILGEINKALHEENYWRREALDLAGYKAEIVLDYPKQLRKATHIKNVGKYIAVKTNKEIIFYPVDKWLLKAEYERKADRVGYYSNRLYPAMANVKYLKSIDIADDGSIRLIYEQDGIRKVEHLNDYKIGDDNE